MILKLKPRLFYAVLPRWAIAVTAFPFVITPSGTDPSPDTLNHEGIHLRQQLELLVIPFYIWYFIELLLRGYRNVSFEQEAYANEKDRGYLKNRKPYSFAKHIKTKRK